MRPLFDVRMQQRFANQLIAKQQSSKPRSTFIKKRTYVHLRTARRQ
jgi:hypothetical protein